MATPLSPSMLLKALRAEGLEVITYDGWETYNRNHKGPWGPVHGIMLHHTVTKGTTATVRLCRHGHSALPGPLCHGVIDKLGRVHLISAGRANHAGLGDDDVLDAVIAEKSLPADNEANTDGNRAFYGFEMENLGDNEDPWPAAQVEAAEKACAAISRKHEWGGESTIGHLEWQPGKIDPRGPGWPGMNEMRDRIDDRIGRKPASKPVTKPTTKPKPKAPAFPGRQYFRLGARNKYALQLQGWLHKGNWGPKYLVGPSTLMTQKDLDKVAALQRHYSSKLGPADGLTGPLTWQYAFEVASGLRKK